MLKRILALSIVTLIQVSVCFAEAVSFCEAHVTKAEAVLSGDGNETSGTMIWLREVPFPLMILRSEDGSQSKLSQFLFDSLILGDALDINLEQNGAYLIERREGRARLSARIENCGAATAEERKLECLVGYRILDIRYTPVSP